MTPSSTDQALLDQAVRTIANLRKALTDLRDHEHAEGDEGRFYSRDECPLCAKIDAALRSAERKPDVD